jgi:hypothetical protein
MLENKITDYIMTYLKYILLGIFVLILILLVATRFFLERQTIQTNQSSTSYEDFSDILIEPNENRTVTLQPKVAQYISELGIDTVMDMVKSGLINNFYDINECHTILHLVGHFAYVQDDTDFLKYMIKDADICGGSYLHGLEAQIALSSSQPLVDLPKFCAVVIDKTGYCYHGVGHEQMAKTLNVDEALDACNLLGEVSPGVDLTQCFKGVFSEYAFQLAGVDGDTGILFSNGPELKASFTHPLDFCSSLKLIYHSACASQLSRWSIENGVEPELALEQCLREKYSVTLQIGCVEIISAIIAQHQFANDQPLSASQSILRQSNEIKRAHMAGVAGEYWALHGSGIVRDFSFFCESFILKDDERNCKAFAQL